jgi:dienelactone hydrolase
MKRAVCFVLFLSIVIMMSWPTILSGDLDELSVLSPGPNIPKSQEMMRSHLRRLSHQALDRRLEKYENLKTADQIREYQQEMRQFFISQLGGFPDRTPLNARVPGSKVYEGFKVEKIIYQSQPGFHVTALMYLPLSPPPYPGVLLLCGHTENGKAGYQEAGMLMAKNGLACLCPDPIGQGERRQLLNDSGQPLFESTTTEHNIEGVAPILLGRNIASYMVWDGIRSIDYLVSRPDIDPERIGCTGNSGGGNMTSFLMALDDRITSAAPSCFISTTRKKNESPGPGDAEQNIHAQTAYGMDHADFIMMRAPRPTLVLSATRDFVPVEGAWEAFRQAKRLYSRLGYGERISIIETDEEHGFSLQLREGSARWMRRWLMDLDDAVTEREFLPLEASDMQCTPLGQVLLLPGEKSVFDLNRQYLQQLRKGKKLSTDITDTEKIQDQVRKITGIKKFQDLPKPKVVEAGTVKREGYDINKLILLWDTDIKLPGLLFCPDNPNGERCLYLSDQGKHADAEPGGAIEKLVNRGDTVLAIDLRGIGETATTPWRYLNSMEWTGPSTAEFFISYMLGKSFLGMRAEDILVAAGYLSELSGESKPRPVHLAASGELGPPALHAAALESNLFTSLELNRSLGSWSSAVYTRTTKNVLVNVVHGALKTYDFPDLVRLFGTEKVKIADPIDAAGKKLSD